MIIRKYQDGDEKDIQLNDIAAREWGDEDDEFALQCLRDYDTHTVIDHNGVKNIYCYIPCEDGSEYVFMMIDKRTHPIIMKHLYKVLSARKCRVWSLSQTGQDKMHKFFGMVKTGMKGDREIWEKL